MADMLVFEQNLHLQSDNAPGTPYAVGRVDMSLIAPLAQISMQGAGVGNVAGLISFQTNLGAAAGPLVEHMRIHTDGKVGIGTSTPKNKLDVEGGAAIGATYSGTKVAPMNGLLVQGSVGIGVTAPAEKLEVAGKVKATAFLGDGSGLTGATDASKVAKAGDTMTGPLSLPANGLSVGSSQLVVNSGNLGVGTATPQNKLDVNGYIAVEGKHAIRGDDPWLRLNQNLEFTAGVHTPGAFAPNSLNVGGAAGWGNPGPGNAWITGTVGIGTATPIRRLHVHSDDWNAGAEIHASGATAGISFTDREMGRQGDSGGPGERWVWYSQDKLARLWTSGVGDVVTVSNGGMLNYQLLEKLEVADNFAATVRAADFWLGHSSRRGSPGRALVDLGYTLDLNYEGDWPGGCRYFVRMDKASSIKLKKNVVELTAPEATELLSGLRPVKFNYRKGDTETQQLGFIAEEAPALIASNDREAVSHDHIVTVLTKIVQQQQRTIAALAERLERLEGAV